MDQWFHRNSYMVLGTQMCHPHHRCCLKISACLKWNWVYPVIVTWRTATNTQKKTITTLVTHPTVKNNTRVAILFLYIDKLTLLSYSHCRKPRKVMIQSNAAGDYSLIEFFILFQLFHVSINHITKGLLKNSSRPAKKLGYIVSNIYNTHTIVNKWCFESSSLSA